MATTAIWDVTDRLDRVIDYAANPEKTENIDFSHHDFRGLQDVLAYTQQDAKTGKQFYVSGVNCDLLTACEQMQRTKRRFQKADGILAFHGYQAFAPGEVTPETAHAIGVRLAEALWGDRFEVVVSTHLDKHHLHNHFVLNSVSFIDGKRYYDNKATYAWMRHESDRLCREYALSVIKEPQQGKSRQYAEWKAEQEGQPTWRGLIRADVDSAIAASVTFTQFLAELRRQGYEIKTGVKYLAVRPPGKERFVRLQSLGNEYTEDAIKNRILHNRAPKKQQALPEPGRRRGRLKGNPKFGKRLTGLQALYIHYLYKMGILPHRRASPKRTHFLLREDLRRLNEIIAQTKLLCAHGIVNAEQLSSYQEGVQQKIAVLTEVRRVLYNRLRHCHSPEQVDIVKGRITELSGQLRTLRKELKLCEGILSRADAMQNTLNQVKQEEIQQRREEKGLNNSEAADQVVSMSLKGIEVIAKIAGVGAKNLAIYLYAVLNDQKRTKGRTRLEGLLRSGKELKVFAVRNQDLKKFTEEAKRYGILYCALRDKKGLDGICDIMVRAEDASKINRIVERFKLSTVETASIKNEIEKSMAARQVGKPPTEKSTPAEKSADNFLNNILAKPDAATPQASPADNPNPTAARTEKPLPSEPISERSGSSAEGISEPERKSVRQDLKEIRERRKGLAEQAPDKTKPQPVAHRPKNKKPKQKAGRYRQVSASYADAKTGLPTRFIMSRA
ncbi:MAG: relaxase/mobilization nuclease domain-containing protein [Bacillota bacterium]